MPTDYVYPHATLPYFSASRYDTPFHTDGLATDLTCEYFLGHDHYPKPTREERLAFHIQSDDYFSTLATVLNLLVHTKNLEEKHWEMVKTIRDDLIYLQKHYRIIERK